MNVYGTVGLPGSGKGEAANVAEAAGVPVVVMGDVIREECRRRGLDPAEHHGRIAGVLREEEGDDAIAARTLPRIREAAAEGDADAVLVDGLRSTVELARFREAFGDDFTLVAIHAPFDLRAERLGDRGRDASDSNLEALRERDARELDLGLGETLDRADVEIDNTGTLAEFRTRIRELLGVEPDDHADPDDSAETADATETADAGGESA
ncbi:AAA family ATPase [Halorubrum vacuolatum]|uniref:Dephospho-CoA kinase n=1 Tax=Halorubrum vacuolatum TaxID=63740 RepID=A0A238VY38_HALVU|nr:AAA family ATPase [Halorubrum vacuolatum]SNR38389.1 Dephospho-CoA kinase [Halorubrum vacuolatum]